jgi:thioesterase domain-containing protein
MKHSVLKLAAISLFCTLALAAQDLGSLGKQAQNLGGMDTLAGLTQKLHLTPQQLQQVLPILQGELPKLQAITGNHSLSNTQKLEETRAVQKQSDSKLKTMLSPGQFTSLQSFRSLQRKDVLQGVLPH